MSVISRKGWLILTCAAGLVGCGTVETDTWMPVQTKAEIAASGELLTKYLAGHTIYEFTPAKEGGHGVQVEFHAANGTSYLWYPGNTEILLGHWRVESEATGRPILCYRYGPNTYNPVLKTEGDQWECGTRSWVYLGDSFKGDVFNLASLHLPFRIPDRNYHTMADLMKTLGRDPASLDMITNLNEINQ